MAPLSCIRTSVAWLTFGLALEVAVTIRSVTIRSHLALEDEKMVPDGMIRTMPNQAGNLLRPNLAHLATGLHRPLSRQTNMGPLGDLPLGDMTADPSWNPGLQSLSTARNLPDLVPASEAQLASLVSVSHWPAPKLFTFGQMAYTHPTQDLEMHVPGSRVVVQGDPVAAVGQVAGFLHDGIVPLTFLETHKEHEHFQLDGVQIVPDDRTMPMPRQGVAFLVDDLGSRHALPTYTSLLKQNLMQKTKEPVLEKLEKYRMSVLTERMSYIDGSEEHVQLALDGINAEKNPLEPKRLLFDKKLEHVMSLQFFTPASLLSQSVNSLVTVGDRFAPLNEKRIEHNVHLIKDEANNGFLTFAGTTNLATLFDVDLDVAKHTPEAATRFALDDPTWDLLEQCFLKNSHTGFASTIQNFVGSSMFPLLAETATGLSSLSLVGHSFGGSLASMFAMCVQGAQNLPGGDVFDWTEIVPESIVD